MTHRQATWSTGRNTDLILAAAALPYCLITVKVIELEKVTRSYMQSLKTFP